MPYPGIPDSKTDKMERCVDSVMKQGHEKSSAIAICNKSITGEKLMVNEKKLIEKFEGAELRKEIAVLEEEINKKDNPILENPDNILNKKTVVKTPNIPKDKPYIDETECSKESMESEIADMSKKIDKMISKDAEVHDMIDKESFKDYLGQSKEFMHNVRTVEAGALNYIKSPAEAPKGATVQRGKRGGYYWTAPAGGKTEEPKNVRKTNIPKSMDYSNLTPEAQKLYNDASEKGMNHEDAIEYASSVISSTPPKKEPQTRMKKPTGAGATISPYAKKLFDMANASPEQQREYDNLTDEASEDYYNAVVDKGMEHDDAIEYAMSMASGRKGGKPTQKPTAPKAAPEEREPTQKPAGKYDKENEDFSSLTPNQKMDYDDAISGGESHKDAMNIARKIPFPRPLPGDETPGSGGRY